MTEYIIHPEVSSKHSTPVLIIEDSLAIVMLLQEFLTTLGYSNIQSSNTGQEGISIFESLVKLEKIPIIFLDYNLPDSDASVILPQILKRKPETKIIIITALDKSDEAVKDVIMKGAYFYLQKPIRLSELKNTMKLVDEENNALERKASEDHELIYSLLGSSLKSLKRICELSNIAEERALVHLKELEDRGFVVHVGDMKEISCNQCGSVLVGKNNKSLVSDSTYFCSHCQATFRLEDAKWITTKAFRAKVRYNFKTSSFEEDNS